MADADRSAIRAMTSPLGPNTPADADGGSRDGSKSAASGPSFMDSVNRDNGADSVSRRREWGQYGTYSDGRGNTVRPYLSFLICSSGGSARDGLAFGGGPSTLSSTSRSRCCTGAPRRDDGKLTDPYADDGNESKDALSKLLAVLCMTDNAVGLVPGPADATTGSAGLTSTSNTGDSVAAPPAPSAPPSRQVGGPSTTKSSPSAKGNAGGDNTTAGPVGGACGARGRASSDDDPADDEPPPPEPDGDVPSESESVYMSPHGSGANGKHRCSVGCASRMSVISDTACSWARSTNTWVTDRENATSR